MPDLLSLVKQHTSANKLNREDAARILKITTRQVRAMASALRMQGYEIGVVGGYYWVTEEKDARIEVAHIDAARETLRKTRKPFNRLLRQEQESLTI